MAVLPKVAFSYRLEMGLRLISWLVTVTAHQGDDQ